MTHNNQLVKKGYVSYATGSKRTMQYIGEMSKKHKKIKNYRVVKDKNVYELYVRYR